MDGRLEDLFEGWVLDTEIMLKVTLKAMNHTFEQIGASPLISFRLVELLTLETGTTARRIHFGRLIPNPSKTVHHDHDI